MGEKLPKKAEWTQAGRLVWFGHAHEPPIFMKRLGRWDAPVIENWKESHRESYIRKLARLGCTNFNTHFFKGFGLEVERDHIEVLKDLVKICHKYGIRANGYTQFGTIVPETFLDEVPEAANWCRINPLGKPILFGSQSFRWRPCYSRQPFIDYIKKCITLGVNEVGLDGIFLDNTSIIGCRCPTCRPYEGCWCDACQEGFRQFLRETYPDAAAAFGVPSFDRVEIPPDINSVSDPMVRAYFDFVGLLIFRRLKELFLHTKSLKSEVALTANGTTIPHLNAILLGEVHEVTFTENWAFPRMEDGCLIHLAVPCKIGTAIGVTQVKLGYYPSRTRGEEVYWNPAADFRLSMAEGMAFGGHSPQTPWLLRLDEKSERDARTYLDFYKKYSKFYVGSVPAAAVAILYPYKAIIRSEDEALSSFYGLVQVLLQNQIPFEFIYREQLKERLKRFRVLAISDFQPVSDQEANLVRDFVRAGGGLYASGRTSICDEHYLTRANYALAEVFGCDYVSRGDKDFREGDFQIHQFGKGRVSFLNWVPEKVTFLDGEGKPFDDPSKEHWTVKVKCRLPERHAEIARTIGALPSTGLPLEVVAPRTVAVDTYFTKGELFVHLINYEVDSPKKNLLVRLDGRWYNPAQVKAYAPERRNPIPLELRKVSPYVELVLPDLEVYSVIRFLKR